MTGWPGSMSRGWMYTRLYVDSPIHFFIIEYGVIRKYPPPEYIMFFPNNFFAETGNSLTVPEWDFILKGEKGAPEIPPCACVPGNTETPAP